MYVILPTTAVFDHKLHYKNAYKLKKKTSARGEKKDLKACYSYS